MSVLFQPLRVGRVEIRNRVIRSATYYGLAGRSLRKLSHGGQGEPIREAYLLSDARVVRGASPLPLCAVGGMRSPPVMEEAIASGAVDCVSLCRPLIREPDLIARWQRGDTRPAECPSCGACMKTDGQGCSEIRCRQIRPRRVEA